MIDNYILTIGFCRSIYEGDLICMILELEMCDDKTMYITCSQQDRFLYKHQNI